MFANTCYWDDRHCTKAASASFKDLNLANKYRRVADMEYLEPDLLKMQRDCKGREDQADYSQRFRGGRWCGYLCNVRLACGFLPLCFPNESAWPKTTGYLHLTVVFLLLRAKRFWRELWRRKKSWYNWNFAFYLLSQPEWERYLEEDKQKRE